MNRKSFIIKLIFILFIAFSLYICAGLGIVTIFKSSVLNEYKNSIAFNTTEFVNYVNNEKDRIIDDMEEIHISPNVHDNFYYVGRLHIRPSIDDNTFAIKGAAESASYEFYTLSDEAANNLANNSAMIINVSEFLEGSYLDEDMVFFTKYQEDIIDGSYYYILMQSAEQFFSKINNYNLTNCAVFSQDVEQLISTNSGFASLVNANMLKNDLLFDAAESGILYSTELWEFNNNPVYIVNHVEYLTIVQFTDEIIAITIGILFIIALIALVTIMLGILYFIISNNYLKNFDFNKNDAYVLIADNRGYVLKSNGHFKSRFDVNNIFEFQNLDVEFLKLGNADSVFFKLKDRTGEEVLLNFLVVKLGKHFKFVGTEAGNVEEFYKKEKEYGYIDSAVGLYNRDKLIKDYNETNTESGRRIFGIIEITNLAELGKLRGRAFYAEAQNYFAEALRNEFAKMGSLYALEATNQYAVYITSIEGQAIFLKNVDKCMKNLNSEQNIKGEPILLNNKAGFVIIDNLITDQSFNTIEVIARTTLSRARQTDKDNYHIYHQSKSEIYEDYVSEFDVVKMLEEGVFTLYYQPQYSLSEKRITGLEALLRLNGKKYKNVNIGKFIEYVELNDKMHLVGGYVFEEGMRFAEKLAEKKLKVSLSLNLSGVQLIRYNFVQNFKDLLAAHKIAPHMLVLEITESVFLSNGDNVVDKMKQLKKIGIDFHLDDFGRKYSSFEYAQKMPIDAIKIDCSFVKDILSNKNSQAIVKSILELCHELKTISIAEGVENEEQLEMLCNLGCNSIQGNFISLPLKEEEVLALLEKEVK